MACSFPINSHPRRKGERQETSDVTWWCSRWKNRLVKTMFGLLKQQGGCWMGMPEIFSGWILWFMVGITWYYYSIHGGLVMVYKPTFTSLGGPILCRLVPCHLHVRSHRSHRVRKGKKPWFIEPFLIFMFLTYPLVNQHNYGKSQFFMGKSTISMAIVYSFL